jgi:hypothetical protein
MQGIPAFKFFASVPPPQSSRRAYRSLLAYEMEDAGIAAAWDEANKALPPPGTRTKPSLGSCPKNEVALRDLAAEVRQMVVTTELLSAITCTRGPNGVDCRATPGGGMHQVKEPSARDVATAVATMKAAYGRRPTNLFEIKGQASEIAVYFAIELGLSPTAHGEVLEALDIVESVVAVPVHEAKYMLGVPRPKVVDPAIASHIRTPDHASLPSGHAAIAHAIATFAARLGGADAAAKARLNALADRIAVNREAAMLHTALDTASGKALGAFLGAWLFDAAAQHCNSFPRWGWVVREALARL